jgi:ferredoxin
VYRLVSAGTLEERIVAHAEKKLYMDQVVNRDSIRCVRCGLCVGLCVLCAGGAGVTSGIGDPEQCELIMARM